MKNFEQANVVEGTDKYVHSTFYFVLAILWYQYLRRKQTETSKPKLRGYVLLGAFLFGVLIEICQGAFTKDRSADMMDVIANTSGALLAILLLWSIQRLKK